MFHVTNKLGIDTVFVKYFIIKNTACQHLNVCGLTEYFDPPENPGPAPNFTEKTSYFLLKY